MNLLLWMGAPLPAAEKALSMSMQYFQMYAQQQLLTGNDEGEANQAELRRPGDDRLLDAA